MPTVLSATSVLDREFLHIRCRLIELAAALDRIERAEGSAAGDPRLAQIRRALETLSEDDAPDRAGRVQLAFSLPYEENWRQ